MRSLLKAPGFTVVAILVIAVGIGANTAVFSVINTVLLKPLTYPDPQSLVHLMNTGDQGSFPGANVPKFNIWRQQTGIFQQVAAYDSGGAGLNLTGNDQPEQVQGVHVTADYFSVLGAPVIAGRTFTAAEDSPHGGNVVVLSYGLWKRRFGGDRGIVGNNIQLNGQPYQVVGVIGRDFVTDNPADLWLPFQFELSSTGPGALLRRDGAVEAGRDGADGQRAVEARRRSISDDLSGHAGAERWLRRDVVAGIDGPRYAVVALRAAWRGRTCAADCLCQCCQSAADSRHGAKAGARNALCAWRWTLAHHSPVAYGESGCIAHRRTAWTPSWIRRRSVVAGDQSREHPADRRRRIGSHGRSECSSVHSWGFGADRNSVWPGARHQRLAQNLAAALNESSNRAGVGFRSGKVRSVLVISEMALALVLVIGAALLIRTFMKLQSVDPGFDTHNVLTMAMSISGDRFLKTAGVAQVIHDGTERLNAVPGVTATAAACCLPLQGGFGLPFNIVGRANGNNPNTGGAGYFPVSWSYFDVFKVPVVRGRNFTEHDNGLQRPAWSSSTRRWRGNSGPRAIR